MFIRLPHFVRYIKIFVKSKFVISRFCPIYFTVNLELARLKTSHFVTPKTLLNRGSLNGGFTIGRYGLSMFSGYVINKMLCRCF